MPSLSSLLAVSVPVLLIAGCGDTIDPATGEEGTALGGENEATLLGEVTPRPLQGFIGFAHPDCDVASIAFEAVVQYQDDLSPVPNLQCHFWFSDGGESFDCAGVHVFAEGGVKFVRMTVTDPDFGGSLVVEAGTNTFEPNTVQVTATAPACGLELAWSSVLGNGGEVHSEISPAAQVVGSAGQPGSGGSVQVTAPGTYTVEVEVEDERRVGPICTTTGSATVEVKACPDDHGHTPDCEH